MMRKALCILLLFSFTLNLCAQFSVKYRVPYPKPLHGGSDTVSVAIIGDVMMHSRQMEHDHHSFLLHLTPMLKSADFAVANMEFSLGGKPYSGYPAFSAPDYYPSYVAAECGVDVFLMGNNHVLDRRGKGLERTLRQYSALHDSLGTMYTGAATDSLELDSTYPLFLFKNGLKIALVNFTYGTNIGPDGQWPKVCRMRKEDVAGAIGRARSRGADFVVVLPHWGKEYELRHSKTQEQWAEWLVDAGADMIVGSHPHVVQDTTHIKGVPVIYSIGNAVSNMSQINTRLGLAVTLKFVRDCPGESYRMLEPELSYIWCTLPGKLTDSYASIQVKEWATRRNEWLTPSDYDNMMSTVRRVTDATGTEGR